jgi:hypothetical protein
LDEALDYYAKTYGAFILRVLREEADARAAVERLLREAAAMFASKDDPPGCLVITAATNCSPQSASVQRRLRSFRALTLRGLEMKMEDAKSRGTLRSDVDAHALAVFLRVDTTGYVRASERRREPRRVGGHRRCGPPRLAAMSCPRRRVARHRA